MKRLQGLVKANAPGWKVSWWEQDGLMSRPRKPARPLRHFNPSPEVIRLVVMMPVRFPLSLRNCEDLLADGGIDTR